MFSHVLTYYYLLSNFFDLNEHRKITLDFIDRNTKNIFSSNINVSTYLLKSLIISMLWSL